jgi:hypothetical protein
VRRTEEEKNSGRRGGGVGLWQSGRGDDPQGLSDAPVLRRASDGGSVSFSVAAHARVNQIRLVASVRGSALAGGGAK